MTYLSLIEKFKILLNLLSELKFVSIFLVFIIVLTFLYTIKKINTKKYTILMLISFIITFVISLIKNYKILSSTFDNFATIFFGNIYFPSIYVYISILVISFTSFIVSMLNKMLKKVYKIINSIMFIVNNILFVIIINIIAKYQIDIFSVNSLYTNTNLVALLELSMGLCIVWILSLIIAYSTDVISDRLASKKIYNLEIKDETFSQVIEVTNPLIADINALSSDINDNNTPVVEVASSITKEEITSIVSLNIQVEESSSNTIETNKNENSTLATCMEEIKDIKGTTILEATTFGSDKEIQSIKEEPSTPTFNDILNGCIEVTYYDTNAKEKEYTLFDPQEIYESNYNKVKNESNNIISNSVEETKTSIVSLNNLIEDYETISMPEEVVPAQSTKLSIEEQTLMEKQKNREERLALNTISLNDLIDEEDITINVIKTVNEIINLSETEKRVIDYKKMLEMLNTIKPSVGTSNINIDDAIALSLINNYSIEDCLKFKKLLESNLNC